MRPLLVGEILGSAWRLYRANGRTLIRTVAAVILPMELLSLAVLLATFPDELDLGDAAFGSFPDLEGLDDGTVAVFAVGQLAAVAISLISATLATAAAFRAVMGIRLGAAADWRSSLDFATRRVRPLVWLAVLQAVLLLLAFAALIVPGVWLYVAWAVAVPALLAEDRRGVDALRRSFRLVRGRWGHTAGVVILSTLIAVAAAFMIGVVFGGIVGGVEHDGLNVALSSVVNVVATVLTMPFVAAVTALVYLDLRVRGEGLDVEELGRRLELTPRGVPAAIPPGG